MKYLLALTILIGAIACSDPEPVEVAKSKPVMKPPSELALVMRAVHEEAKGWRADLESGAMPLDTVEIYEALVKSTPTKPDVGGPVFDSFAQMYQHAVDSFLLAPNIDVGKAKFNNLVDACLSCHQSYCPGPMPTIRKLKVKETLASGEI